MRIVQANKNKPLVIGRQGENEVTTVQFDVSGWATLYGEGTFTLTNLRPTESLGYACTVTVADEVVSWVVKSTDVYIAGEGHVQLTYTVGDQIAKSVIYFTRVQKSLNSSEVPDDPPDWAADVLSELARLEALFDIATTAEIDSAIYS